MKIHPVGTELFAVNRWTDMTKLIVTFCNFVNVPKNVLIQKKGIPQHLIQTI
jgi:hypothetical protein